MINNDYQQQMTPQMTTPQRQPPMPHVKPTVFWDEEVSLPLSEDIDLIGSPGAKSMQSDAFSSDPSLGIRVQNSLKRTPRNTPAASTASMIRQQRQQRHAPDGETAANESTNNNTSLDLFLQNQLEMARHPATTRNEKNGVNNNAGRQQQQQQSGELAAHFQETIDYFSAANKKLAQEKRIAQAKVSELITKCKKMETLRRRLDENLASADEELQKNHQQIEELKSELNKKDEKLSSLKESAKGVESEEIQRLRKANEELNKEVRSLLTENRKIRTKTEESVASLEMKEKECQSLKEERKHLLDRLEKPVTKNSAVQTMTPKARTKDVQTDAPPHASDYWKNSSMSERLNRIREVSERTCLSREHQQEMDQLRQEHEKTLREMEVRHLQQIHEVEEQAVEEHSTKLQQCKRTQSAEYQKRLVEIEERHRLEINKTRKECNNSLSVTEDSLEVALTQVTAITEQHEHESQLRKSLEVKLEKAYRDHEQERLTIINKHKKEVSSLLANAENERNELLDELQRNAIEIIKSKRRVKSPSSVTTLFDDHVDNDQLNFKRTVSTDESSPELESSPSSHAATRPVSQSLAETEAYVLSVLGGNAYGQ